MLLGNRAVRHVADKRDARCDADARARFSSRATRRPPATARGWPEARSGVVFVRLRDSRNTPPHRRHDLARQSRRSRQRSGNAAPVAGDDGAKIWIEPPRKSAVDPTRSQNSTVSWRRSIGRASRASATSRSMHAQLAPHSPQNLFQGRVSPRRRPTAPHCRRSALPTVFPMRRDFGCAIPAVHTGPQGISTTLLHCAKSGAIRY